MWWRLGDSDGIGTRLGDGFCVFRVGGTFAWKSDLECAEVCLDQTDAVVAVDVNQHAGAISGEKQLQKRKGNLRLRSRNDFAEGEILVRSRGLEPPRLAALAPQASASASSATTASSSILRAMDCGVKQGKKGTLKARLYKIRKPGWRLSG